MFTIRFYKNYPFVKGGERVPRPTTPAIIPAYLARLKVAEYTNEGTFFEGQERIIVDNFDEIDGANFCSIEVAEGDTHYYYIDDIRRVPGNPAPDAAEIYITEDVFLTDFFQVKDGRIVTPTSICGRIAQTDYNFNTRAKYYKIRPVEPIYKAPQISVIEPYPDGTRYAFIGYTTAQTVGSVAFVWAAEYLNSRLNVLNGVQFAGGITTIVVQGKLPLDVSLLNLFIIPYSWVENLIQPDDGSYFQSVESTDNIPCTVFDPTKLSTGIIKVAELSPGEITADKTTFKTAMHEEPIEGTNNESENPTRIGIYLETSVGYGTDTLTILATINNKVIDLTEDFKVDYPLNEAALQLAQHKSTAAINSVATVIGSVGGVIGGATSGNYFGAVSSAIAGIEGLTSQYEGLKNPPSLHNAGNGGNAIAVYGGLAFYQYSNAANADEVSEEINARGYLYPQTPYRDITDLITANAVNYMRLLNAEIVGNFGADVADEIAARFARGIMFIRLKI